MIKLHDALSDLNAKEVESTWKSIPEQQQLRLCRKKAFLDALMATKMRSMYEIIFPPNNSAWRYQIMTEGLTIDGSPLHHAANRADDLMVKVLLQGMSRSQRYRCVAIKSKFCGFTPFHYGAAEGNAKVIDALLLFMTRQQKRRIFFSQTSYSYMPHHYSALKGNVSTIKAIFKHADRFSLTSSLELLGLRAGSKEETAMHIAVKNSHHNFVKEVMAPIVSFVAREFFCMLDKNGQTVFHRAEEGRNSNMLDVMRSICPSTQVIFTREIRARPTRAAPARSLSSRVQRTQSCDDLRLIFDGTNKGLVSTAMDCNAL